MPQPTVSLALLTLAALWILAGPGRRRAPENFAPPKLTARPGVEYTAADSAQFQQGTQIPEWNAKWVMWNSQHRQRAV